MMDKGRLLQEYFYENRADYVFDLWDFFNGVFGGTNSTSRFLWCNVNNKTQDLLEA